MNSQVKSKIMNDPVYGFINIPSNRVFDIIEHPFFQRLRRIKQLGLTYLVYPGAYHTRFQHAIGAMHLMDNAISTIEAKGHTITKEEKLAVLAAILLHDIGHGPFSHALEYSIVQGINHEKISAAFMNCLNIEFGGELELAIEIFQDKYPKRFLHQLVSSQLDVDRLDYLRRDSFFSGVTEGVVGSDRIIKMLNVVNDQLVVESKGIYSIEKFLVARRLMYWQVYLHKTVISAEQLLVKTLKRARFLSQNGENLFATPSLAYFLNNSVKIEDFENTKDSKVLKLFSQLDDYDIMASIKVWTSHSDFVLAYLSKCMIERKLFKIMLQNSPFDENQVNQIRNKAIKNLKISPQDADYFVFTESITNYAYSANDEKINILYKNGELVDIAEASDMLNISVLSRNVKKYFLCYPKEIHQT
ncbi:MAG: HD domain-containing protein [Bacteroidales bacterium]|nr:HD domain-containing protein [Bacteroidales bacterium]